MKATELRQRSTEVNREFEHQLKELQQKTAELHRNLSHELQHSGPRFKQQRQCNMITRDERQAELEGMPPMQLVTTFETAFSELSVIGFPLKKFAIHSILQKEFNEKNPVRPTGKRQSVAARGSP